MFTTLIEKILLEFLGQYIDGIKNSMDVALLKGKITIQNVSLKKDFFNNLSLPLRLTFSLIQSINIHIPWSSLKQKPTIIEVDGIYALFYVNYQMEEYKFDAEKRLNEMIDKATELIKMKLEEKQRDSDSIVEKYILRIIDNLKVTVKNVHVRLQSMQRKWDFSMGLLVDNVQIYTINEKGQRHFFVRSRRHGHIHLHHRKERHNRDDELLKKVSVDNVRLYFTEYETNFMTALQSGQLKLKQMKEMLQGGAQMLLGEERARNEPNIVLRLRLEAILKAKLNDTTNKYDIDVHTNLCPITVNLTDRMTAEIFYFSQFAFEWQMRKYKRPNKDVPTSPEMVNFYKLMMYNILSDTPIHKSDYKNLIRLVGEWQYDFLNDMTIEFVQQQKVKKQLSRKKNRKISGDVVMLQQFKKEIQQRVLTEQEKKEIFDIIGRVGANIFIPVVEIVLMKSKDQYNIFAQKQQQILKIGCQGISLTFNTLWSKDQAMTLEIKDLIYFSETDIVQRKISTEPLKQALSHQSFLSMIFTKSTQQQVQSFSITLSKRLIRINQRLVSKLISWSGSIKLRPATVNYLKQICIHYTTEIVKTMLQKLFRQFRVINLNVGLPVIEIVMDDYAEYGIEGEEKFVKQNVMRLDLGSFEGKMVQQGMYRFQFTQDANLTVNKKSVLNLSVGTCIEIFDKAKILQPQTIQHTNDRQKISLRINQLTIQNIDSMIDFLCVIIGSRILQQFLRIKIVQDQSTLLQGTFYLNNNSRRQKIILKSDRLVFLPSKYTISLKQCKVYQMKVSLKNYLVFHSFITNKTDVVEVENQLAMETIFYKLRQQIHEVATTSQWDMFYKADYPVTIQKLQMLKSHHGENQPLFNFEMFVDTIRLPLTRYLLKQQQVENKQSFQQTLIGRNALEVLQYLQSDNTKPIYQRPVSTLYISHVYLKIACYQLTKDFFSDVKQIQLIIEDEPMFNNFSFSSSLIKSDFFLLNFIINSFELSIQKKQKLKSLLEIGFYFETQVEKLIKTADQCDLWNRIQKVTQQNNDNFSMLSLSSSKSFTNEQQLSRTSANFENQPYNRSSFKMQQSFLLSLRMSITMKSFKMNILNYITEIKNFSSQVEIYRTQYFPLLTIKAQDVLIMSGIQLKNVQFRVEKDKVKMSKINLLLNVQKVRSYPDVQLLIIDITQGEISGLVCQVIQHLARRREYRMNQSLIKKPRMKRRTYPTTQQQQQQQPHVRFEQQFISPIKQQRSRQLPQQIKNIYSSPLSPKFPQQSPLFKKQSTHQHYNNSQNDKQIYWIDVSLMIKKIQVQVTLGNSNNSNNNTKNVINVSIDGGISLQHGTLSITKILITQRQNNHQQQEQLQDEQILLRCNSIIVRLPLQHQQQQIIQQCSQQQNSDKNKNISIEELTRFQQSPFKTRGYQQIQHQVLIEKENSSQKEIYQKEIKQKQLLNYTNTTTLTIQLSTIDINLQLSLITQLILFIQQCANRMHRSKQYNQLRQKITLLLLKTVQKRQQIQKVVKQTTDVLVDIKENIKENIQENVQSTSEIYIRSMIDLQNMFKNVTLETLNNHYQQQYQPPIKFSLLSSHDNQQLITAQLTLHIDYPSFSSSFITAQVSHFNKLVHVYEPVLQRTEIKVLKLKQQIEVSIMESVNMVVSQQMVVDLLKQGEMFVVGLEQRRKGMGKGRSREKDVVSSGSGRGLTTTTPNTTPAPSTTTAGSNIVINKPQPTPLQPSSLLTVNQPTLITTTTSLTQQLSQQKLTLYKKYKQQQTTLTQHLVNQTLADLEHKQRLIQSQGFSMLQRQFSMTTTTQMNEFNKNQQTLQNRYDNPKRYSSKMQIKNYTGCQVLCQLVQMKGYLKSERQQKMHLYPQDIKTNLQQLKHQQRHFYIPFNFTATKFTTNAEFIQRQRPLRLNMQFLVNNYRNVNHNKFTQELSSLLSLPKPITTTTIPSQIIQVQIMFSQICRLGTKREIIDVIYQQQQQQQYQQQQQTMRKPNKFFIQLIIRYQYIDQLITVEIKPMIEVVNCTVIDIGVMGINSSKVQQQQQQQKGNKLKDVTNNNNKNNLVIKKNSSMYLPLQYQFGHQQLAINLPGYNKPPSTLPQQHPLYTLPLKSQQNLQQNYPKQNTLVLKQSFIHYFNIQLGNQQCYIPLLFVRIKKFEKFVVNNKNININNEKGQSVFKQTKSKLLIMPLIKLENHLQRELFINGEFFGGQQRGINNFKLTQQQHKQRQHNSINNKSVYFFLRSQATTKSITHLMLSFNQNTPNYHIQLPQQLYIPKQLTFPTESEFISPIAFNLLSTKNQYGQVVLHFYPILEVLMQLPVSNMQVRMVARLGQREKVCQGLNVLQRKQQLQSKQNQKSQLLQQDKRLLNKKDICYLLPQHHSLIKLQMMATQSKTKTISSTQTNNSQQFFINNYLSSTMPQKKHLTFINLNNDSEFVDVREENRQGHTHSNNNNNGSSQSINSMSSSSSSSSHPSSSQSSSSESISTDSILAQQLLSSYNININNTNNIQSIKSKQIYIPTIITSTNQMLFCKCLLIKLQKRFKLQQQLSSIYTINQIDQYKQNTTSQQQKVNKYEKYHVYVIKCIQNDKGMFQQQQRKQYLGNKQLQTVQTRRQLVQQQLVGQIKEVSKLKQLQQKLTRKLASKSFNLFIKQLNISLIIQKPLSPSYNPQEQLMFNSSLYTTTPSLLLHQQNNHRHQLMNITLGEIESNVSLILDQFQLYQNNVYEIQLEQKIGVIKVNSIDCQAGFGQAVMRLNQTKMVNLLIGLRVGAVFVQGNKVNVNNNDNRQDNDDNYKDNKDKTLSLTPQIELNKLLVKIIPKPISSLLSSSISSTTSKQQSSSSSPSLEYDFNIKVTDKFIIQTFNWLIKMYPMISAVVTPNTHKSLLEIILQSDSLNQFLQNFQGLMLIQQIKLKLAFLSIMNKKGMHSKNTKKNNIIMNKQTQNLKVEQFLSQLLRQYDTSFIPSQIDTAYRQSKTMQRILRYIKKIPFSILEVQNSHIAIPQIAINGKLQKETLRKFQRQVMINFSTGIIKGMKLLGSPSSLMDYLQKHKNKKKRQKLSGLLNRLAQGSIISFTGILKSFSNGISQLTFDEKFKEQREDTMESSNVTQKESKPKQGLKSLFLGIKSGFTGLVEQPVQNYKQEGAQGFIKGSLKGVTGLITKPLTGILDLGTKALQNVRPQKRNSLNEKLTMINLQKSPYCRPLFYQCSLIRRYTQTEYLSFIILKSVFGGDRQLGLISSYELKQNPFNQDKKRTIEKQNVALKLLDPIRYLLAICCDRTYFMQIGNQNDYRLVYKQVDHSWVRMVGRDQAGVCLVVEDSDGFVIDQEEQGKETKMKDMSKLSEIFLNPFYTDEKQEMFTIYKKLTKK